MTVVKECPSPPPPQCPPPPLDADTVFFPYLRRLQQEMPALNWADMLRRPMDVVVMWKGVLSDHWRVNMTFSASEVAAFLNYTFPSLRACGRDTCQFWLLTALAPDMFPSAIQEAFAALEVPPFFYDQDTVAKLLMYKFLKHGRLLTFITDADDFVESTFFQQVMDDLAMRRASRSSKVNFQQPRILCYRPKAYRDFYAFGPEEEEEEPRVSETLRTGGALRIMMGVYTQGGMYQDVLSMDHTQFNHKMYTRCDKMVLLNATAFYVRRLDSSSALRHDREELLRAYDAAVPWVKERGRYQVAF